MKYTYSIKLDIRQDAWNWWNGCNSSSHGMNWKTKADPSVIKNITNKDFEIAFSFLIPYLKTKYLKEKGLIAQFDKVINKEFADNFDEGCDKIVQIMGKPIYRNDFTIYLSTFRRGPYDKDEGLVWICVYWKNPLSSFIHELCHFQFIHYWREDPNSSVSKLSNDQFEFLKESLTMIMDESFYPLIEKPDKGYELHQPFRKELSKQWNKLKNFDDLVEFGVKNVSRFV